MLAISCKLMAWWASSAPTWVVSGEKERKKDERKTIETSSDFN